MTRFDSSSAVQLRRDLFRLEARGSSMEEAAQNVVKFLYDALRDGEGEPAVPLVRCYVTQELTTLPEDLQSFVRDAAGSQLEPRTKCFTLLGTAGDEPEWNDRRRSQSHQAIPLQSEAAVQQLPMVSRLIAQLGFSVPRLLAEDIPVDGVPDQQSRIFYVDDAEHSPYIPAKDFVDRYGIRTVVGFGGVLVEQLFAVIMFSRVPIAKEVAQMFGALSLTVELQLLKHRLRVFSAHR